jgi:hypothetical protein
VRGGRHGARWFRFGRRGALGIDRLWRRTSPFRCLFLFVPDYTGLPSFIAQLATRKER